MLAGCCPCWQSMCQPWRLGKRRWWHVRLSLQLMRWWSWRHILQGCGAGHLKRALAVGLVHGWPSESSFVLADTHCVRLLTGWLSCMQAGGFIAEGRVNGSLNLSRALGDMEYKQARELSAGEQMVTALPEVRTLHLESGHEFLLLACDGIWDVLTNQEVRCLPLPSLERSSVNCPGHTSFGGCLLLHRRRNGWPAGRAVTSTCQQCIAPQCTAIDRAPCLTSRACMTKLSVLWLPIGRLLHAKCCGCYFSLPPWMWTCCRHKA